MTIKATELWLREHLLMELIGLLHNEIRGSWMWGVKKISKLLLFHSKMKAMGSQNNHCDGLKFSLSVSTWQN